MEVIGEICQAIAMMAGATLFLTVALIAVVDAYYGIKTVIYDAKKKGKKWNIKLAISWKIKIIALSQW